MMLMLLNKFVKRVKIIVDRAMLHKWELESELHYKPCTLLRNQRTPKILLLAFGEDLLSYRNEREGWPSVPEPIPIRWNRLVGGYP